MSKRKLRSICTVYFQLKFVLVIILVMLAPFAVQSQTMAIISANSLNVRDMPEGKVVDTLSKGSAVAVSTIYQEWAAIIYSTDANSTDMKSGWVSKKYLELQKTESSGARETVCETEYDTGAEVCISITNTGFDCTESYAGNYYSECEADVSYELVSDYRGGSSLSVDVECEAEVSYQARESYDSYETEDESNNHNLYSNSSVYGSVDINVSFPSYQEVYKVELDSVDCEIANLDLW